MSKESGGAARSLRWMGLVAVGLVVGLASLGIAAHYRRGVKTRALSQDPSLFSTVALDTRARVRQEEPPMEAAEAPPHRPPPTPAPRRERSAQPSDDPSALLALA